MQSQTVEYSFCDVSEAHVVFDNKFMSLMDAIKAVSGDKVDPDVVYGHKVSSPTYF